MTLRQIKHIQSQHPNPKTIIRHNVAFILPLRLSTSLETEIDATQFPIMEKRPIQPMILSVSSFGPNGSGSKVIFITEYQDATTPLNKLQAKVNIMAFRLRKILRRPGKKAIRSIDEDTLGGCFGFEGKCATMATKHANTNPASVKGKANLI